jgi:hypothetical protein
MTIGLDAIDHLTGRRLGTFDVPCPLCGPFKRSPRNQRKAVLRVYRIELGFAGYHCARCGEKGGAIDRRGAPPDLAKLAAARREAAERDRALRAERLNTALWLWHARQPIGGSIAEYYLRSARGYGGPLPATIGFLPARGKHPPAMIAAFGLAHEIDPGILAIADSAVIGVHVTRLKPDGSGKATFEDPDANAKIMIGHSAEAVPATAIRRLVGSFTGDWRACLKDSLGSSSGRTVAPAKQKLKTTPCDGAI